MHCFFKLVLLCSVTGREGGCDLKWNESLQNIFGYLIQTKKGEDLDRIWAKVEIGSEILYTD